MPPRKSNVSAVSNGGEDGAADTPPSRAPKDGMSVEDLSLPKSMVARLSKGVLPANTSIQKDALLALHKSATVFVNYIASNANELTQAGGKKTIMPPEIITALRDAEFEDFLPRLEAELKKYNEVQCDKRNTYRKKVKEDKAAATAPEANGGEGAGEVSTTDLSMVDVSGVTNGHADDEDDAARPFKKFKAQNGSAVAPDIGDGTEEAIEMDGEDGDDDVDETLEDDEVDGEDAGEDGGGEDDEGEEEGEEEDKDSRDDLAAAAGLRDEALDEHGSDSD